MARPVKKKVDEDLSLAEGWSIVLTPPADWCLVRNGRVRKHLLAATEDGRKREARLFIQNQFKL